MTTQIAKTKNEIILYQPDNSFKLEVVIDNDTVWLTQEQMAQQQNPVFSKKSLPLQK